MLSIINLNCYLLSVYNAENLHLKKEMQGTVLSMIY